MAHVQRSPQQTALFQKLKPLCIKVSDYALRIKPNTTSRDLQSALSDLHSSLLAIDNRSLLTPAMGDYIFFPLSHILRRKNEWSDSVLESTLKCVNVLLQTSWSSNLALPMFEQFCLMLVIIIEGKGKEQSEDVKGVAAECLVSLFLAAERSVNEDLEFEEAMKGAKLRPLMGHTATAILDVLLKEALLSLRLDAIKALDLLYNSLLGDGQIVAGFLPFTVSTISRTLSSSASNLNHKLIVSLLDLLRKTLSQVLDDGLIPHPRPAGLKEMYYIEMTESWYNATKGQVKIALESFFPLVRTHSHPIVRESAIRLCESLLVHCSRTLENCQSLLVETVVMLQSDDFPSVRNAAMETLSRLRANVKVKKILGERLEEALYDWCLALPRTMRSNDDAAKVNLLRRIMVAVNQFSNDNGAILSSIQSLITSLQDVSVFENDVYNSTRAIQPSQSLQLIFEEDTQQSSQLTLQYAKDDKVLSSLQELLHAVGRTSISQSVIEKLLSEQSIQASDLSSNAWLALQILQGSQMRDSPLLDDLSYMATNWLIQTESSFSPSDIPTSTILISLSILSFTASARRDSFRSSLIDILYPLLSLTVHPSSQIRATTRSTLDIIAKATGYGDTQTLILENTDYLVNSVALKLNVFDVSVQVLATLYTVVRLAGNKVVPYMDDVWACLFDIVDRFHGYEKLVTGVFAVMTGIVSEISKTVTFPPPSSNSLLLNYSSMGVQHTSVCEPIAQLIETILKNEEHLPPKPDSIIPAPPPPLPPKTSSLLQTLARKSILLTTHPSPNLRFNLILLLQKAIPLLSIPTAIKKEDGEQQPFLPLVAQEIWPSLCAKVNDPEVYVRNAALETICELLSLEGEFLGSKVEKDLWPQLKKILTVPKLAQSGHGKGNLAKGNDKTMVVLGGGAGPEKEVAVKTVCAIVRYSEQKPAVFDEMLEAVWPWIENTGKNDEGVRRVFEMRNVDAVWLMERKAITIDEIPGHHNGYFIPLSYV